MTSSLKRRGLSSVWSPAWPKALGFRHQTTMSTWTSTVEKLTQAVGASSGGPFFGKSRSSPCASDDPLHSMPKIRHLRAHRPVPRISPTLIVCIHYVNMQSRRNTNTPVAQHHPIAQPSHAALMPSPLFASSTRRRSLDSATSRSVALSRNESSTSRSASIRGLLSPFSHGCS